LESSVENQRVETILTSVEVTVEKVEFVFSVPPVARAYLTLQHPSFTSKAVEVNLDLDETSEWVEQLRRGLLEALQKSDPVTRDLDG